MEKERTMLQSILDAENQIQENNNLRGYVYYGLDEDQRFSAAKKGDDIVNDTKLPPWIVVDHNLNSLIVTKWPGKLFEVEILDQANEKELNKGLVHDIWYTRTAGVRIVQELPTMHLFGMNGAEICRILDSIININESEIAALSACRKEHTRALYSKAWEKWIAKYNKDSYHAEGKHYDTLKLATNNSRHSSSPIQQGLSVVASQLTIRAREVVGKAAFKIENGEECLVSDWANAMEHLLHAAMANESDGLLTPTEKKELARAFEEIFGEY